MKIHGTSTDKLADIVQSLQLIRKSGLLTVERDGVGNASELGTITFRDGQVTDATIGQLRGANAFKSLMSWRSCRFIFDAAPPVSTTDLTFPLPSREGETEWRDKQVLSNGHSPGSAVPYHSQRVRRIIPDFYSLGLSRIHRQLFLLIDGKRSFGDLTRLIGRHPQEVMTILADLEDAGLINR